MENEIMEKTTTVYRLKPVENTYEVPELDLLQFADILGDDDLSLVRRQPRTNESLLEKWTPSRCELAWEYKQGLPVPDVSFWGSYLLLSEEAFYVYKTQLTDVGEFLALQVGYMQMYIFVPMQFVKEDISKTVRHYDDGFECGVETLVFEPSSLAGKTVFKSEMYGSHGLFVTDCFKAVYEKHNFTCVEFVEDLAGLF